MLSRKARLSGNELEQSSGCGDAVDKAVQQHGVSSVLVKYVVGSVICEVCLVWHRFCVEWVASDVLDDQEKDVEHTVEWVEIWLMSNGRFKVNGRSSWKVVVASSGGCRAIAG